MREAVFHQGSQSRPVPGPDFKPGVRHLVSRVGSTPTGFRHLFSRSYSTNNALCPSCVPNKGLPGNHNPELSDVASEPRPPGCRASATDERLVERPPPQVQPLRFAAGAR